MREDGEVSQLKAEIYFDSQSRRARSRRIVNDIRLKVNDWVPIETGA